MTTAQHTRDQPQGALARLLAQFQLLVDAERDRWFLWIPVCLGVGAGFYFSLLNEPTAVLAAALLAVSATIYMLLRGQALASGALAAAVFWTALGFADAKLRTSYVATPALSRATGAVTLKGWVERSELRPGAKYRLTLAVISIEPLRSPPTPRLVRVTVTSKKPPPEIGKAVVLRARLAPLPEPVEPGGFDFARKAWFAGLGGIGYALGPPKPLADPPPYPAKLWFGARIERLRRLTAERITAALPGDQGGLATALITGDRGAIPPKTIDALRHAGLAHVLAISGMHMAMVAGALFWLLRAALAAVPHLALGYPIKKWAAALAFLGAGFYLALSGAAIATQRAFIMITIMFLAVLLDRAALTLRNVAIAAVIILLLYPESIVDVSFQMSFAAVVALVAVYEAMSRRKPKVRSSNLGTRIATTAVRYVGAIALTTLIASIAVAPFAAFHFHKLAQFSLVANLLAMPIFGLLVMPMALACLLAMPFGLEAWPLALMGYGLNGVTAIAAEISSWPGAVAHVAQMPVASLVLLSIGGLWLCLWRGPVRSLGIAIAAVGLIVATGITRPDVLIGRGGGQIAIRDASGSLKVSAGGRKDTFALERWLLADGDDTVPAAASDQSVFACDALACIAEIKGKTVALVRHPAAVMEECAHADVVISQVPVVGSCDGTKVVIDRRDLWAGGSHAVFVDGPAISAVSAASLRGSRPWVRRPPGAKSRPRGSSSSNAVDSGGGG